MTWGCTQANELTHPTIASNWHMLETLEKVSRSRTHRCFKETHTYTHMFSYISCFPLFMCQFRTWTRWLERKAEMVMKCCLFSHGVNSSVSSSLYSTIFPKGEVFSGFLQLAKVLYDLPLTTQTYLCRDTAMANIQAKVMVPTGFELSHKKYNNNFDTRL